MADCVKVQNDGDIIDFVAGADYEAGDVVVLTNLVGINLVAVKSGDLGSLDIEGIYDFPKASGTTFAIGASVYWDVADGLADADNTNNKKAGIAVLAGVNGKTTVRVKLER